MKHTNDVFGRLGDILRPEPVITKPIGKFHRPCTRCNATGLIGMLAEFCDHCGGTGVMIDPDPQNINEDDPRAER